MEGLCLARPGSRPPSTLILTPLTPSIRVKGVSLRVEVCISTRVMGVSIRVEGVGQG